MILHAKDDHGREIRLPITNGPPTIRKGDRFTISGDSHIYRVCEAPESEESRSLGGWARDMHRRWVASGMKEERQIQAFREYLGEKIGNGARFTVGGEGVVLFDGEVFHGRCKNCQHWEEKSAKGWCNLEEKAILTKPTDVCKDWEKCKGKS